jgi:hypothetical protein
MPWTEEQIDELINNVRRDFALDSFFLNFQDKLREHGVTIKDAEKAIGKHSFMANTRKMV